MSETATTNPTVGDEIIVRQLTVGETFDREVFDEQGILLAPAGAVVTNAFLDKLTGRGIRKVRLADRPASAPTTTGSNTERRSHRPVERPSDRESVAWIDSESLNITDAAPRLSLVNLREEVEAGAACYNDSLDRYTQLGHDVLHGKAPDANAAGEMIDRFMKMLQKDHALGALVMQLKSDPDEYLFHHGLNVALLSMAIALNLGYDEQMVFHAGIGALFSDIGMLRVPHAIRFAPRPLTKTEWLAIEQHPMHTANALEHVPELHSSIRLTAYQTHERNDGSGYPRRRRGTSIHPLARVVAVADTYAAMTASRPHRPDRIPPYQAIVTILQERTRLDRMAARAMLDYLSLFPIGSEVILSDDSRARVLRSNMAAHTRPVVVPLDGEGNEIDTEIDLTATDTLKIVNVPELLTAPPHVSREGRLDSAA